MIPKENSSPEKTETAESQQQPNSNRKKRIVIPFVLPWESCAAKESQKGMGSFGTIKNPVVHTVGGKELPNKQESEGIIPLASATNRFASQKNSGGFGQRRYNITKPVGGKELDPAKLRASQGIIPRQSGSNLLASQSGQTPMGSHRSQVPKIQGCEDMAKSTDSEALLPRLFTPNPNCHAGTGVIDIRRRTVPEGMGYRRDKRSEGTIPRQFDTRGLADCKGTGAGCHGLGAFRQVVTPLQNPDGYDFSEFEIAASKKVVPIGMQGDLEGQERTGGFSKRRDVVGHANKYRLPSGKKFDH